MFLFSVVIDHANNPMASTGKFECIYQQTMTRPRLSHANRLKVIGFALRPKYYNTKATGSEVTSSVSSKFNGLLYILLNTLNKLDYKHELNLDDTCLDKCYHDGIGTRIHSSTGLNTRNTKSLDIKSVSEMCLIKINSDAQTELNYGDSLDANSILNTKSNMANIKLHAITKPCVNSDVDINSYIAKTEVSARTKSVYNDCLDTKSDVKAKLELDALTQSQSNDYFDKLNLEINSHIGSIKLDAITRPYCGDCFNANLDVETSNYVARKGSDGLTKTDNSDCLVAKLDLEKQLHGQNKTRRNNKTRLQRLLG